MKLEPKNTPDSPKQKFERLAFTTRMATPDDWEAIKDLREFSINSEDADMLGMRERLTQQLGRTEEEWRADLSNDKNIYTVAFIGSKLIGISFGTQSEGSNEIWDSRYVYVLPEFGNSGVGKELFARRLRTTIERGGKTILISIRNPAALKMIKAFVPEIDNNAKISEAGVRLRLARV